MSNRNSDPGLLEAYRKQLRSGIPIGLVYLAWQGQTGILEDDLLDEVKTAERELSS